MGGEWREVTLDQLGRIVTGKTPSSSRPDYFGGEIPFVTPTDFDGRRIIETTGRYLTESGADAVGARIPARAVMVSCIGSDMGKVAVAGRDCVTNQQINSIIVTCRDDPLFVYYNLSMRKAEIRGMASGSAQPILNKSAFGRLEILLPPPDEQRAIAHILGTLDDKIELNRRMSETLEAMARALFKSWFVDFDPVRAKCRGGPLCPPTDGDGPSPQKGQAQGPAPTQWSQHILDLFPERFVDSELGEIPEGWGVGALADVTELLRDQINPLDFPATRFRHFSIPAFDEGRWPKDELGEAIKSQKSRVLPGVVLLSKLNPEIERVWLVDVESGDQAVCSTEFLVLRPFKRFGRGFTYCFVRSPLFRQGVEGLVTGTSKSHQRAQAASILALPVVLPSLQTTQAFERQAELLLTRSLQCRSESRSLAALRDALLPKLISGEMRVRDAEKFVGRAV